jgi:hypothetical protein
VTSTVQRQGQSKVPCCEGVCIGGMAAYVLATIQLGMASAGMTPNRWPEPEHPCRMPVPRVESTETGFVGDESASFRSCSPSVGHSRASRTPFAPMTIIEMPTAASMYPERAWRLSAPRTAKARAPTSAAPMPCPSPQSVPVYLRERAENQRHGPSMRSEGIRSEGRREAGILNG